MLNAEIAISHPAHSTPFVDVEKREKIDPLILRAMTTVRKLVQRYAKQMEHHPLASVLAVDNPPKGLLIEYAGIQYVDSVLWVPMLAIMKDRVSNPTLKSALTDNLLCEAGAKHQSHVVLCQEFIRSLKISPYFGDFKQYSDLSRHSIEMMNAVSGMSEVQIAGMNLASEAMVPYLFSLALPAFQKMKGVNTNYLVEHIAVDADDHAQRMYDSIESLLSEGTELGKIIEGIHLGARTALSIPDALYSKHLRRGYSSGANEEGRIA